MTKKLSLAAISICMLCQGDLALAQSQTSQQDRSGDVAAIKKLEAQWISAYFQNDTSVLDRLESDDYTVTNGEVLSTKAQQLGNVRQRKTPLPVAQKVEQEQIRFLGDGNVALVTEVGVNTPSDAGESPVRLRETEIWVKKNNEWKVTYLHYNRMTAER